MKLPWVSRATLEAALSREEQWQKFYEAIAIRHDRLLEEKVYRPKVFTKDGVEGPQGNTPSDDLPDVVAQACEMEADGDETCHRMLRLAARKRLLAGQDAKLVAQIITSGNPNHE